MTATLADRFLYSSLDASYVQPKVADSVRARLRKARRFVLDETGARRFGEVVRDVPDLLIREQQFARAPFETCWFEFPFPVFHQAASTNAMSATADALVGYLVDSGIVYVLSGGTASNANTKPVVLPVVYHLHDPWTLEDQLAFCGRVKTSRIQLDAFLWGTTLTRLDSEEQRALRSAHSCRILPTIETRDGRFDEMMFNGMVEGSSGDLRNIIALLLLMNRPSLTRYVTEAGPRKHFFKGKQRTFLSHTVVTIPLDPVPTLRLVGTTEGETVARRRHEVRGHYCHDETSRTASRVGCQHTWTDDPAYPEDDNDHWVCSICQGRRWWRKKHERGDSSTGFNDKQYRVTG